ncbi:MAG: intradiol ring-cleavage dioxygenase [Candidatus Rokuibacteriota bacterium]
MIDLNEHTITPEVIRRWDGCPDPRFQQLMAALIHHLHDFAREVKLTEAEWMAGIKFLTAVGHKCDDLRQEFILLSDTLGLSQLVVAQNHSRPPGATEQTVFGPFWVGGAPRMAHGADIANGAVGDPCHFELAVNDLAGRPVAGATVDVWHADARGGYDVQAPGWTMEQAKMRGVFQTDSGGKVHFWSVVPACYPVPTDGPVGDMLRAANRHPMRPGHLHVMVQKPGYDTLITHLYVDGDPYLDSDAVFGVRRSCIGDYVRHAGGPAPDGRTLEGPFYTLEATVTLARA